MKAVDNIHPRSHFPKWGETTRVQSRQVYESDEYLRGTRVWVDKIALSNDERNGKRTRILAGVADQSIAAHRSDRCGQSAQQS